MAPKKKQKSEWSPLLEWAVANGAQLSGVAIRQADSEGDGDGVGIWATEKLDAGKEVLWVPETLALSADLAVESAIGKAVEAAGFPIIRDVQAA